MASNHNYTSHLLPSDIEFTFHHFCVQEDWVLCRVFYKNRETSAKQSMGSYYDDTGSSSLPALMDSYISFDQQAQTTTHLDEYEQVPCFSFFSQNQTNPNFNHTSSTPTIMEPNLLLPAKNNDVTTTYEGGTPYNLGSSCLDPSFSYDRKVLKAVLNQITKMESDQHNAISTLNGSPSFGEGSSESYLSEVCMPNLWNNF